MKYLKKLILFSFFALAGNFSLAQNYINYTISDGLPSNHVYRITQDNLGFIWIITDKGMVKFDGKTFKLFTTQTGMPINDVWNIRVTPDNKVWYLCYCCVKHQTVTNNFFHPFLTWEFVLSNWECCH